MKGILKPDIFMFLCGPAIEVSYRSANGNILPIWGPTGSEMQPQYHINHFLLTELVAGSFKSVSDYLWLK